ncbi:MAG: low molecular weight phosphotyrosine protein phosphatase [Bacteroidales bacterium]|nr:low molecular weight phosphotyrosine protein phosphatase [Bacteroidales bacterium]
MNVLFVCQGNTCRSPLAEGILKKLYHRSGISGLVDSAGFSPENEGASPNPLAVAVAMEHGIRIEDKRARTFQQEDFTRFDIIYVMDQPVMDQVVAMARSNVAMEKVDFLMNLCNPEQNTAVPDPYNAGAIAYNSVYSLIEKACIQLENKLKHHA